MPPSSNIKIPRTFSSADDIHRLWQKEINKEVGPNISTSRTLSFNGSGFFLVFDINLEKVPHPMLARLGLIGEWTTKIREVLVNQGFGETDIISCTVDVERRNSQVQIELWDVAVYNLFVRKGWFSL